MSVRRTLATNATLAGVLMLLSAPPPACTSARCTGSPPITPPNVTPGVVPAARVQEAAAGCKRAGCGARCRQRARALARRVARCRCRRRRRGARRTAAPAPGARRRGWRCRAGPAPRSATSGQRPASRRRRRASARRGRRRQAAAAGGCPAARCLPMRTSSATCAAWLRSSPRGAEALDTCHTHLLERPPHGLAHLHACRPGARWTPWSHVSFLAWCRSEQCTTRMSCWHGLQLWKGARGPCCRRFQVWCCGAQERQAAARRSGSLGAASPDVKPQVRGGMPCAGDLLHSAVPPGVRQSAPGTSGVDLPQPCSRCPGLGGVASRPTCRPPMCLHNTFLI